MTKRFPRARRIALRIGLGLVITAAVYLVGIQILLRTRALRSLVTSSDDDSVLLDYTSAWSWFPGQAHFKNLKLRSKDSHVEWLLTIDEGDLHVDLLDLLHRRFHVTSVHGTGVTFVARLRLDPAEATPERLAGLPPIEGLEAVPIAPPPLPPPSDADYKLWTVYLENVVADSTREIWIDDYRFQGDARATGGFYLKPIRWASVGPASLDVRSGTLTRQGDVILSGMRGHFDTRLAGFDPRTNHGIDPFAGLTAWFSVDGGVPDLTFARHFIDDPKVTVSGGAGTAHVDVHVVSGRLQDRSVARVELARVALLKDNVSALLDARAAATVDDGSSEASLEASELDLHVDGFAKEALTAKTLAVAVTSSNRDITKPFDLASLAADAPTVVVADARALNAFLPKGDFGVDSGQGTMHGHVEIAGDHAGGALGVDLTYAAVRLADVHAMGAVSVHADVSSWDSQTKTVGLANSAIALTNITMTKPDDAKGKPAVGDWWGRVAFPTLRMKLSPPMRADMGVVLSCKSARPVVAWLENRGSLPAWAGALVTMNDLRATAVFHAEPGSIELRKLEATGGDIVVKGMFVKHGAATSGGFLIETPPKTVGIDLRSDKTSLVLFGADEWYEKLVL